MSDEITYCASGCTRWNAHLNRLWKLADEVSEALKGYTEENE